MINNLEPETENYQDLYKTTLDLLPIGCQIIDFEYRYIYLNCLSIEQSKKTKEELLGQTMMSQHPGIENTEMFSRLRLCMNNRISDTIENKIQNADGTEKCFKLSFELNPFGILVLSTDITELKQIENSARNAFEFQNIILNGTEYSIISTDSQGIITTFNRGAELMLGYKAEEVVGKTSPALLHDIDEIISRAKILSDEFQAKIEPGFEVFVAKSKLGKADSNEWTYIRKDKSRITVELSVTTLRNNDNTITGFLGIAKDITENKLSKQELIKAKEQAEEANRSKSEFLANMSHEIRTPLNGVIGFTDLLMNTNLDDSQKQYMNTIYQSANSLLDIINDILDFSKIEAGKLELNIEKVNLNNLIKQVIDLSSYKLQKKNLNFNLVVNNNVPHFIHTDSVRLKQVILNLLENAIKFTEKGKIEININAIKVYETERKTLLHFSVKDTGIGIPIEKQQMIFDTFTQADSSISRKFGGTGLGLSISNKLLGLMKSKLELESEFGKGSNFHFTLLTITEMEKDTNIQTFEKVEEMKKQNIVSEIPFRILIADDSSINLFLMNSILKKILPNAIIIEANNGKKAIEKFKDESPDMIFLDLQMPEMNGYEVSLKIRKLEKSNPIPIIALTASALKGEKEKCLGAGMNDFIAKPVLKKTIEVAVRKWLVENLSFLPESEINQNTKNISSHYNEKELRDRLENDEEFIHILLTNVNEDFENGIKNLTDGFEKQDINAISAAAHKIKGTALTLCFDYLALITEQLELQKEFNEDKILKIINEIKEEINLLKEIIKLRFNE